MQKILFISLLSFFICSCQLQPVTVSNIDGVKVNKVTSRSVMLEVSVKIKNPNPTGLTIYKSHFDVKLNEIQLGRTSLSKKIKIKSKSESIHTVMLESDISKLGASSILSLTLLLSQKKSPIATLNGEIKAGRFYYKKTFPFELKQKIPLRK